MSEGAAQGGYDHYGSIYGRFEMPIYAEIRAEAYDEDIGQNSWMTRAEHDRFAGWLRLEPGSRLLDLACGTGGPSLRMASRTGCEVVGVDLHAEAIAIAGNRGGDAAARARFDVVDAREPLPFADAGFDAVLCVDSVPHLGDRTALLRELGRVLRPGGRLAFTDTAVITGQVSLEELEQRASSGAFRFVPPGHDEECVRAAGLVMLEQLDLTDVMAESARRRHRARAARANRLREIEGDEVFEAQQAFLDTAARLADERRLGRIAYLVEVSEHPDEPVP